VADQNPTAGSVPEIQNKASKPPGVSPKNRQTLIMLAVGGLIAIVIAFSNSSAPPKTRTGSKGGSATASPTSPKSVRQYVQQLDEDAKSLAQERAHAEQMKAEAMRFQAGQQNPYQNPYQAAPAGANAGAGQPVPRQLTPEETERNARRKQEQEALRASNVALSFRKDQPQANAAEGLALSPELSEVRQLIDAQKAALATTMQPPSLPVKTPPEPVMAAVAHTVATQPEGREKPEAVKKNLKIRRFRKQRANRSGCSKGPLSRAFL
jgi:hypothetical protein